LGVRAVPAAVVDASRHTPDQLGAGIVTDDMGDNMVNVVSDPLPDPSA
jgi:hypothetical protein